jgi:hypothetical protein
MRKVIVRRLSSVVLVLPVACGSASRDFDPSTANPPAASSSDTRSNTPGTRVAALSSFAFPGAGSSGAAAPLSAGLGPETSTACNPSPAAGASSTTGVRTVCFFGDDKSVPAATIQQIVEVVGTDSWVHLRLTLNPDFVDNTYGETAIGWDTRGNAGGNAGPGAPAGDPLPPPGAPNAPPAAPPVRDAVPPLPDADAGVVADPPPPPDAPDTLPPNAPDVDAGAAPEPPVAPGAREPKPPKPDAQRDPDPCETWSRSAWQTRRSG